MNSPTGHTRMPQLDSLRAIAVGLVMFEHFAGRTLNAYFPIGAGTIGVGCFFTLSGFLITGILLRDFDRRSDTVGVWRDFYVRRLLRLVPAFYAVLFALVALNISPIAESWPWHAAYLTNVWIALGNPSNVFWTLAVEEQFYLLWPFAIVLTPRRYLLAVSVSLIGGSLLFKLAVLLFGFSTKATGGLLPANLSLLAFGCILAILSFRHGKANCFDWYTGTVAKTITAIAWISIAAAVITWAIFGKSSLVRYFTVDILCGVFYAWLIVEAARGFRGWIGWVLDSSVLQYIGQISYGLYLVHNWMPRVVEKLLGPLPTVIAGPIVLASTFAICILSWHLYEKPFLSLGRVLQKGRAATGEAAGANIGNR